MKRTAHPPLSHTGNEALASYEHWLREREDLALASIRNYLSDLRHFIAWYETERETDVPDCFIRVSRYIEYLLCSKNATGRVNGKGGPTAIRQTRRRLVDALTQDGYISIERPVIVGTRVT
jgi:hypothetical protein